MASVNHNWMIFANTYFVSCGQNGYLSYASQNSVTSWSSRWTGTAQTLNSVAHSGTYFVAVGEAGAILKSDTNVPSTAVFTVQTSGTTENLNHVEYANGIFVAVGNNGTIVTSSDGVTWTVKPTGSVFNLARVRYLGTTWYAIGQSGALIKSTDNGVTWLGGNNDARPLYGIAYNGSMYSAVYKYSYDGINWQSNFSGYNLMNMFNSPLPEPRPLWAKQVGGSNFLSTGLLFQSTNGSSAGECTVSSDGKTFAYPSNGYYSFGAWYANMANNQMWVAGDGSSAGADTSGRYNASGDTTGPWASVAYTHYTGYSAGSLYVYAVAYGNGYYVALGTVTDTATPTQQNDAVYRGTSFGSMAYLLRYTAGTQVFPFRYRGDKMNSHDMVFGNNTFVITGARIVTGGTYGSVPYHVITISTDNGATWSSTYFSASNTGGLASKDVGSRIAFGNGVFVVSQRWYSNGGYIMRSTTCAANSFTTYYTGYASKINEVKFLNGYFYTVHDNGGIARSADGITWTQLVTPVTWASADFKDIARIGTTYVLCSGSQGTWQTSTDGVTFTAQSGNGPANVIVNDGTKLVSANYYTSLGGAFSASSTNGSTWTTAGTVSSGIVPTAMAYGNSTYVAAYGSRLFYSTNLTTWTEVPAIITPPAGTGIVIKDASGVEILQSYDSTKQNYLCTRLLRVDYVTTAGTQINVPEANGYKIFTYVLPTFAGNTNGIYNLPYVEYHRGAGPTYTPYFIVRYPPYGGGYTPTLIPAYCLTFTTGVVEQSTY